MGIANDLQPVTLASAREMFGQLAAGLSGAWDAQSLRESIRKADHNLREPMRVALVGQIKKGKSTLVNALIQRDLAATGLLETTFSVTELYHASEWEGFVCYRDGSKRRIDRQDLELVTVRNADALEQLRMIDRVCIGEDVELLRKFRLIDTPGLGSVYRDDSANTLALLDQNSREQYEKLLIRGGKTGQELHRESYGELGAADSVLFLFSAGLADYDTEVVTRFLGEPAGSVTPLTAIGVLSMCDRYWSQMSMQQNRPDLWDYDPLGPQGGGGIAAGYLRRPEVSRLFYDVVPVAAIAAAGAWALTDDEIRILTLLAGVEPTRLIRALLVARRFTDPEQDLPASAAERRRVLELLGAWGLLRACRYLRDNVSDDELRQRLDADSGVGHLRQLILSHFGNRAGLIKLHTTMGAVRAEINQYRAKSLRRGRPADGRVAAIADTLEEFELATHDFAELSALAFHYQRDVNLSADEAAQLAQVTGEYGTSLWARLGASADCDIPTLRQIASERIRYWHRKQNDISDWRTREIANTVWRSYRRIALWLDGELGPEGDFPDGTQPRQEVI